jgi:hypothetical protein
MLRNTRRFGGFGWDCEDSLLDDGGDAVDASCRAEFV